jgi:prolyl-tRNA synthetase
MRQSLFFTKTQKAFPRDEEAINAKYLIKAGYIRKMSAGVYAYLPLAWRVLEKINRIIREEMNAAGGQELLMPALTAKEYWEKSRRWGTEIMYKLESPHGEKFGLGWTHEEIIAHLAADFIHSYKDLPLAVYQIQTKFRAEPRAKNGLLRGREFLMKDLYSFHASKDDLDRYYQEIIRAYGKILKRLNLKYKLTEAAGGAFTKEYTHEFQVLNPAGEDAVFYCNQCDFAQNKEIAHAQKGNICPRCGGEIQESAGIEVANVFKLGARYSEAFDLRFADQNGDRPLVIMGSYGIGPTRLMAALVEEHHDADGIIWPESVSPYQVHLIEIKGQKTKEKANKIYRQLEKAGVEVLYDDRDVSAGEKFADADLLGISQRAVISEKTGVKIEIKKRGRPGVKLVPPSQLVKTTLTS